MLRILLSSLLWTAPFVGFAWMIQDQPHTDDPAKCVKFCYPKGGPDERPKGIPPEATGYECQGDRCGRINDPDSGEEEPCSEHGGNRGMKCTSWCAKVCCSCLATCL